jgi:hypothetical protein
MLTEYVLADGGLLLNDQAFLPPDLADRYFVELRDHCSWEQKPGVFGPFCEGCQSPSVPPQGHDPRATAFRCAAADAEVRSGQFNANIANLQLRDLASAQSAATGQSNEHKVHPRILGPRRLALQISQNGGQFLAAQYLRGVNSGRAIGFHVWRILEVVQKTRRAETVAAS